MSIYAVAAITVALIIVTPIVLAGVIIGLRDAVRASDRRITNEQS
jgi:hypothetical protein